jgi:cell wall-associated NlpC family hydrolase
MIFGRMRTSQVFASLLSAFLYIPAAAQHISTPPPQDEGTSVRLASLDEGEAIVEAAWELRRGLGEKPDCSHFVNAIYERAGVEYDYASSSDLFEGIDGFRRVYHPQPGDLIVWRGHVGIVVDPDEHTFYSSIVTGFAIESYRSRYWLSRGHPRFYRYLIDEAHRVRLSARRDILR